MKYFVMSDIHCDFYCKTQEQEYDKSKSYFEKFYENYMQPADCLICAGDIANDYYNHVNFLKFISTKYKDVYVVFGNHDMGIAATFGNGNPVKYSEQRLEKTKEEFKNTNIHILDGNIVNNIGGTMGMCDFHHTTSLDMGIPYKITQWQKHWYDGRVWHIKTPEWHSGYKINPIAIWVHEKEKMINILKNQPKVMITHFCPLELGINRIYDNSSTTAYFYFEGKELLELVDHEMWWFCGHIHTKMTCDYVNSKGVTIHICALPHGYPEEGYESNYGYKWTNNFNQETTCEPYEFNEENLIFEFNND